MYGSGRGHQRRSPFTGSIWDFSPFRSGGSGGDGRASRPTPQRSNTSVRLRFGYNYDDYEDYDNYNYYANDDEDDYEDDYEDEPSYNPVRGGMRPMGGHGDGNAPTGQNFSYTSYRDSDGNVCEQGYSPGGSYGRPMGRGQVNDMSGGSGRADGNLFGGRGAGGPFMSSFWTGANPFRDPNGRTGPAGVSWRDQERGVQPDGAFAIEYALASLPRDNGLSEDNITVIAEFLQQHTKPAAEGGANAPPNTECPICLEPPSGSHRCVQIKGIPGCTHMIGRECLYELLIRNSDEKKECPLCRTEFLASNFIEQRSEEWNQLAQGRSRPARGRAPTPAHYGGAPTSYAAAARGPPRGMPNVRGMGDVGMNGPRTMGGGLARGSPPGNFNGAGQRLGGPQSGYYQQQYAPNYGGRNYAGRRGRM